MLGRFSFIMRRLADSLNLKVRYLVLMARIMLTGFVVSSARSLRSILPFLLILLFLAPSAVLLAAEPEWPWMFVGGNFQITRQPGDDFSPSVAANGDLYLVVWYRGTDSGFDIYGARVTWYGHAIDPQGFPICTATGDQMFPVVAWDGESFFVVWQDRRSGKRWDLYGARVTRDGEVLNRDGSPLVIGKSNYDQIAPALAFDGETFGLAWHGKRNSRTWNVYFATVSRDGTVLSEKPIPLSPSTKNQASAAIAFGGENYLVVWQDLRGGKFYDIYGTRVTPSGKVLDPKGVAISPIAEDQTSGWDKWRPVLSWNGNLFLVVWMASRNDERWYIEGKRVDKTGQVLDLLDISVESDTTKKTFPALVWDDDQFILVWEDEPEGNSRIFAASVGPDYKPFTISEPVQVSSLGAEDSSFPVVGSIGNGALVIWQGVGADGYWQIFGQRVWKVPGAWF